jgi:hypothetical protein
MILMESRIPKKKSHLMVRCTTNPTHSRKTSNTRLLTIIEDLAYTPSTTPRDTQTRLSGFHISRILVKV